MEYFHRNLSPNCDICELGALYFEAQISFCPYFPRLPRCLLSDLREMQYKTSADNSPTNC